MTSREQLQRRQGRQVGLPLQEVAPVALRFGREVFLSLEVRLRDTWRRCEWLLVWNGTGRSLRVIGKKEISKYLRKSGTVMQLKGILCNWSHFQALLGTVQIYSTKSKGRLSRLRKPVQEMRRLNLEGKMEERFWQSGVTRRSLLISRG